MNYRAVLFDVDGVLLDTREFIFGAFEYVFAQHGATHLTRADAYQALGLSLEDMFRRLMPDEDPVALTETFRVFQEKNFALVTAFPGAEETLGNLKATGFRLGVISTRKKFVSETLDMTGLLPHIDLVLSAADVTNIKPHPEGLVRLLEEFGVPASAAAMVGDQAEDIMAGKNAGTSTVGVSYGIGDFGKLQAATPDFIIDNITQLTKILIGSKDDHAD